MKKTDIPIPTPCDENWDTMTPEGRKRFCDKCKKHVYDLSRMGEASAQELLERRVADNLCVSFLFDTYGNVVFQMVDTKIIAPSKLLRAKRAAVAATATLALATTMACGGAPAERLGGAPPPQPVERTSGEPPAPIETATPVAASPSAAASVPIPSATTAAPAKHR